MACEGRAYRGRELAHPWLTGRGPGILRVHTATHLPTITTRCMYDMNDMNVACMI